MAFCRRSQPGVFLNPASQYEARRLSYLTAHLVAEATNGMYCMFCQSLRHLPRHAGLDKLQPLTPRCFTVLRPCLLPALRPIHQPSPLRDHSALWFCVGNGREYAYHRVIFIRWLLPRLSSVDSASLVPLNNPPLPALLLSRFAAFQAEGMGGGFELLHLFLQFPDSLVPRFLFLIQQAGVP